ncbi:MAG: phage shock protein operon transcriptional activator [Rhodothalassiaceae bacterium]
MSPDSIHIVGTDPAFLDLMDRVSEVAPLDRPVLVIGERGTGKELVAARLHYLSPRWGKSFVKVNCAALPETLIDSELFGVEPGAFTGASRRRAGRFEQAQEGSLFLDEIATLSSAAQEKLLRIVEYGEYERLGGDRTLKADVRVIGAANLDLPALAEAGKFRADLLDRLSFDVLTVPPLRARRDDIPLLAEHFALGMARELRWEAFPGFSADAMDRLMAWSWPGNVRELKNVVERAVYRAADPTRPIDRLIFDPFASPFRPVAPETRRPSSAPGLNEQAPRSPDEQQGLAVRPVLPYDFKAEIARIEKSMLAEAYAACRHNQRECARALGLGYEQFRHLARKHGVI